MKNQRGLSFIELIITLTLIGIISYAFTPAITTTIQSFTESNEVIDRHQKADAFFLYLTKLLHNATQITTATATSIEFQALNQDYRIQRKGSQAPYTITLQKNNGPERLISDSVKNLTLDYKNQHLESVSATINMKLVDVSVTYTGNDRDYPFVTSIRVENNAQTL